ncbi:hypothetical protein D5S18_02875 [Nocardia panacis]|uniref:Uncharacterized protein n=1 Tax=Nocardia panacis TaxID=2340916 RepID=A0A3A4KVM6_9NOCA|nr:hypothetical protein [Nocardia panacis]RJO79290.1 hypothetical protein D5S18_02875 [Nocardia panacis]
MSWEELFAVALPIGGGLVVVMWEQIMRSRRGDSASAMTSSSHETSCETNNYEEEGRRMREPTSTEAVES